jgi:hypothetical protein
MELAPMDRSEPKGPTVGSLEARASLALKALAAISVVGVLFAVLPVDVPDATLLAVAYNAAALAVAALYLAEALGLDRNRPWAVAAVRPLMGLIGASGMYLAVAAVADGKLRIPFDVVLAIWVFLGPAYRRPIPKAQPRGTLLFGGVTLALVVILGARPMFGWGGLLDVRAPDLKAVLSVNCGAAGAGVPPTVSVTLDWSWSKWTPFPSGTDVVVIGWTGVDADGRQLFLLDETTDTTRGIHPGLFGDASNDMANQVASESRGSFHWGIPLGEQQLAAGHLVVRLLRTHAAQPSPQPLQIRATYVHVGLWRSDTPTVTCSW